MGNLYRTKDIKQVIDELFNIKALCIILDRDTDRNELLDEIYDIRQIKEFTDEVIDVLEEKDRLHDAEMAEWEAKKKAMEAEKNGQSA